MLLTVIVQTFQEVIVLTEWEKGVSAKEWNHILIHFDETCKTLQNMNRVGCQIIWILTKIYKKS